MANWQFTLDFESFWKKESVHKSAGLIADEIKKLIPSIRRRIPEIYQDMADELENEILPLFKEIAEMKSDDVEEFDSAMYTLYEWADASLDNEWGGKKMCWVKTLF